MQRRGTLKNSPIGKPGRYAYTQDQRNSGILPHLPSSSPQASQRRRPSPRRGHPTPTPTKKMWIKMGKEKPFHICYGDGTFKKKQRTLCDKEGGGRGRKKKKTRRKNKKKRRTNRRRKRRKKTRRRQ